MAIHRGVSLFVMLLSLAGPAALAESPVAVAAAAPVNLLGPALRSTDLERSVKFYTTGLGMVVAARLDHGRATEVIFSFAGGKQSPVILLYKDRDPGKSPPIDHGDGFGHLILRVGDAGALASRLVAAGYEVGEISNNPVNHMKVFWVADPDGYKFEITEAPAAKP